MSIPETGNQKFLTQVPGLWFLATLCIFFMGCSLLAAEVEWFQIRSEHFIVYCNKEHEDFAKKVSHKAEKYYHSIAEDLGYVRYANFWKWENRGKIFIYPDNNS